MREYLDVAVASITWFGSYEKKVKDNLRKKNFVTLWHSNNCATFIVLFNFVKAGSIMKFIKLLFVALPITFTTLL